MPVNTLKNVVLPAPLGPMIEAMVPSRSSKSTELSAVSPPKRLVTPLAESRTAMRLDALPVLELPLSPAGGEDALRPEDHHQHQDQAEHHPLVLRGLELSRQVGQV